MEIETTAGVVHIKKHKNTKLKTDIIVDDNDEDKNLITGEVISGGAEGMRGKTVIFGKYAIFQLLVRGVKYHFINVDDILAYCDYEEKNV